MGKRILNERGDRNAWNREMMAMLGLKPGHHLPDEGMAERLIQGVRVYVRPVNQCISPGHRHRIPRKHRIMAICQCGRHVSAGRLHQHLCKEEVNDAKV